MTGEILAHGDERPRRSGRAIGVAGLAVLLAVAGVAVARSGSDPPAARQGWTEYPSPPASATPVRIDDGPVVEPPDPFAEFTRAPAPRPGAVTGVLLAHGRPGFLRAIDGDLAAFSAFGGPEHAPVLVGWCAESRTFQDASRTYAYDEWGASYGDGEVLDRHDVRRKGRTVEIAGVGSDVTYGARPPRRLPARCPSALRYPPLPSRVDDVHKTIDGFRVVRGRYVVTTESASFCAPIGTSGCAAQGWEAYRLGTLPGSDLAGSYTWQGDFVVRGDRDGRLTAARMPGARLVSRTDVGKLAVLGTVAAVVDDDPLTLRVGVRARNDANGVRVDAGELRIVVSDDTAVFLGRGYTGLSRPPGTPRTLREFVVRKDHRSYTYWFVLDADGQAVRVVIE